MVQKITTIDTMGLQHGYLGQEFVRCLDCKTMPDESNIAASLASFFMVEYEDALYNREHLLCICAACVAFYRQSPDTRITRLDQIDAYDCIRLIDLRLAKPFGSSYENLRGDIFTSYRARTGDQRSLRCERPSDIRRIFGLRPLVQLTRATRPRQPISARLRYQILQRDNFACRACGRSPAMHGVVLHVDHIVPVVKGGADDPQNLRALCADCNLGKSDN
jgi:hypothetical protein